MKRNHTAARSKQPHEDAAGYLRDLLRRAGLTQRAAAALLDINERTVRGYLGGRSTAPAHALRTLEQAAVMKEKQAQKRYGQRQSDECYTPRWISDGVLELAGRDQFDLDPCAPGGLPSSDELSALAILAVAAGTDRLDLGPWMPIPTGCSFAAVFDGLSQEWTIGSGSFIWCNPPYSDAEPWIRKCWEESQAGSVVVALVRADGTPAWWHRWVTDKAYVVRLPHRVRFFRPHDQHKGKANFQSALLVYGDDALAVRICQKFKGEPTPRVHEAQETALTRKHSGPGSSAGT